MIEINSFDDVMIDGESVGDCIAACGNYPKKAAEILRALIAYDTKRQGEADTTSTEAAIEQANKSAEPLQQKITELEGTIAQLQLETAPDIAAIAAELQAAGLTAWADRAITAADPDNGVLNLVLALYAVAQEARSLTQCDRVRDLFMQIGTLSGVWPTPEEATAMQAILTASNVGEKWLKFA